jgi:hypothetical protein
MITWIAAEQTIEYDNEAMRIAKLQLGCNVEIRSLLKRAQEIKAELHKRVLLVRPISSMLQLRSVRAS